MATLAKLEGDLFSIEGKDCLPPRLGLPIPQDAISWEQNV